MWMFRRKTTIPAISQSASGSEKTLSRYQFLAALHDESLYPLAEADRASWKTIYAAEPLATYFVGRTKVHIREPRRSGLLALPRAIITHVSQFLGDTECCRSIFNVSRGGAALCGEIKSESLTLRVRPVYLHEDHCPTAKEQYTAYWKAEKMVQMYGHCWLLLKVGDEWLRFPRSEALFQVGEIGWNSRLDALAKEDKARAFLPHVRTLVIPDSAQIWTADKAAATSPAAPSFSKTDRVAVILSQLTCPNIEAVWATELGQKFALDIEDFCCRHAGSLMAFAAPSKRLAVHELGRASAGFPPLDVRALRHWRFLEYQEMAAGSGLWPRRASVGSHVPSMKVVGHSYDIDGEKMCIASLPASLSTADVVGSIRAMAVTHRPACVVLAKVADLKMRLHTLTVAECGVNPCAKELDTDAARAIGVKCVTRLTVKSKAVGRRIPSLCASLEWHLMGGQFSLSSAARGGCRWYVYARKDVARTLHEEREAKMCSAVVRRLQHLHPGVELRLRAW
eukprot:Polyplicarium_translucidae@DN2838_c1_g2_i1.p1